MPIIQTYTHPSIICLLTHLDTDTPHTNTNIYTYTSKHTTFLLLASPTESHKSPGSISRALSWVGKWLWLRPWRLLSWALLICAWFRMRVWNPCSLAHCDLPSCVGFNCFLRGDTMSTLTHRGEGMWTPWDSAVPCSNSYPFFSCRAGSPPWYNAYISKWAGCKAWLGKQ